MNISKPATKTTKEGAAAVDFATRRSVRDAMQIVANVPERRCVAARDSIMWECACAKREWYVCDDRVGFFAYV